MALMKKEVIRRKMREHSDQVRAENDRLKQEHQQQLGQLQQAHDKRIAELQRLEPKNRVSMEELIAECERR